MKKTAPGLSDLIARLLLSGIFLLMAGDMLIHPESVMESMVEAGIPFVPAVFVIMLTLHILGGLALALGYRTRTAALILFFSTIAVAFVFYPPWSSGNWDIFLIHLGICGGLLLVHIHGPGTWSFDGRNMVPVKRRRSL